MNNDIIKSLISGLLTGLMWFFIYFVFFFILVNYMKLLVNHRFFDDDLLYRVFIMGGTIFLLGFACGAPAKYRKIKTLQDDNYKWGRTYLLSSILCFVLILLMALAVPTKTGISGFAKEPGGTIFFSIIMGLLLPVFGELTIHKIDKHASRRSSDNDT